MPSVNYNGRQKELNTFLYNGPTNPIDLDQLRVSINNLKMDALRLMVNPGATEHHCNLFKFRFSGNIEIIPRYIDNKTNDDKQQTLTDILNRLNNNHTTFDLIFASLSPTQFAQGSIPGVGIATEGHGHIVGGSLSYRYFKIISVNEKKINDEGRYKTKGSPGDAAKKAFTQLSKKYKTNKLTFSIKETTQSSPKREHGPYLGEKIKLKKPLTVKYKGKNGKNKPVLIKYETKIHLVKDRKQKGGGGMSSRDISAGAAGVAAAGALATAAVASGCVGVHCHMPDISADDTVKDLVFKQCTIKEDVKLRHHNFTERFDLFTNYNKQTIPEDVIEKFIMQEIVFYFKDTYATMNRYSPRNIIAGVYYNNNGVVIYPDGYFNRQARLYNIAKKFAPNNYLNFSLFYTYRNIYEAILKEEQYKKTHISNDHILYWESPNYGQIKPALWYVDEINKFLLPNQMPFLKHLTHLPSYNKKGELSKLSNLLVELNNILIFNSIKTFNSLNNN